MKRPKFTPDSSIGELIRTARRQRRLSQMDLALDAGISPRHLSFLETGRSHPSADVLLALAECLSQSLRMRNKCLLAAGYAPRYTEEPLASPHMSHIHAALHKLLQAHDPYPGVVLDSPRLWRTPPEEGNGLDRLRSAARKPTDVGERNNSPPPEGWQAQPDGVVIAYTVGSCREG